MNYASAGNGDLGIVVNRGAPRYAIFALGPVFATALLVGATVAGYACLALQCAVGIGVIHALVTQGRRIIGTVRHDRSRLRLPTLLYAGLMFPAIVIAAVLGGLSAAPAQPYLPNMAEFLREFWITAFALLVGTAIVRASKTTQSISGLVRRSRTEVGSDLLKLAKEAALERNTDATLVEAILLTENLQRPSWVRRLERAKGRLWPTGSYGVMQTYSYVPISDEESIQRAVTAHLRDVVVPTTKYGVDHKELREICRRYNDNDNFVELAAQVYEHIWASRHATSKANR